MKIQSHNVAGDEDCRIRPVPWTIGAEPRLGRVFADPDPGSGASQPPGLAPLPAYFATKMQPATEWQIARPGRTIIDSCFAIPKSQCDPIVSDLR